MLGAGKEQHGWRWCVWVHDAICDTACMPAGAGWCMRASRHAVWAHEPWHPPAPSVVALCIWPNHVCARSSDSGSGTSASMLLMATRKPQGSTAMKGNPLRLAAMHSAAHAAVHRAATNLDLSYVGCSFRGHVDAIRSRWVEHLPAHGD